MLDDQRRLHRLQGEPRTDLPMGVRMHRFCSALQHRICRALVSLDGEGMFREDVWTRQEGGGGVTRVMEDGRIFEKGGVNVSAVHGRLPQRMAELLGAVEERFFATGISIVIHPRSPMVPCVHANFRYFALGDDVHHPTDQWWGGGADLTPCYPVVEDVLHFHTTWQAVCGRHEIADYERFKRQCDDYFYLPHRKERRGVGGIFYDYLREDAEACFYFARDAGRNLLEAYLPIVRRRMDDPYGEREVEFQEIRRGRYVEFNLILDRGTRFGIETAGRTESILMSLPPRARWVYDWKPEPGSREDEAMASFARK